MTLDELNTIERSVIKRFSWGEVYTIEGDITLSVFSGSSSSSYIDEINMSVAEARRIAKVASPSSFSYTSRTRRHDFACHWLFVADEFALELISKNTSVRLSEQGAKELAAALRGAAVRCCNQPTKNRTDDNLRSVFG